MLTQSLGLHCGVLRGNRRKVVHCVSKTDFFWYFFKTTPNQCDIQIVIFRQRLQIDVLHSSPVQSSIKLPLHLQDLQLSHLILCLSVHFRKAKMDGQFALLFHAIPIPFHDLNPPFQPNACWLEPTQDSVRLQLTLRAVGIRSTQVYIFQCPSYQQTVYL